MKGNLKKNRKIPQNKRKIYINKIETKLWKYINKGKYRF